jgi:predicted RNA-binding protein YlxR (DUF448 family)
VACRTRRDKTALVRFVRRPDRSVLLDREGTLEGRGAYLCDDGACWVLAAKHSALQRALRTQLPIELRTRLEQGDAAAIRVAPDRGAPAAIHGGNDGA